MRLTWLGIARSLEEHRTEDPFAQRMQDMQDCFLIH